MIRFVNKNFSCTDFAFFKLQNKGVNMFELLISMFGLTFIFRILSLLEKFEVLNRKKMILFFVFLQVPIYFFIFFKELFVFTVIYIGIFFVSLIFFNKILSFFAEKTFLQRSIQLIDELILLMKTGKSAQTSIKIIYSHLSNWEKIVFKPTLFYFEHENCAHESILKRHHFYFEELKQILRSSTKVIDQLSCFREGLRIQRNLRHRSGQVTKQIHAQAVVAIFIYIGMFFLSWFNFNLSNEVGLIMISLSLFVLGQVFVFVIGGKIKWKT